MSAKQIKTNSKDFEKSLSDLEKLVEKLEQGKLSLNDSLESFEQGVKLYQDCKDFLDKADKKIEVLSQKIKTP